MELSRAQRARLCPQCVRLHTICSKCSPTFRLISHPPRTANSWNFRICPATHVSQLTSNLTASCTTKEKVTVNSTRKDHLHASILQSAWSSATSVLPSLRQLTILLQCIPCQTCCSIMLSCSSTGCKPNPSYPGDERRVSTVQLNRIPEIGISHVHNMS